nr:uncharacterized protein LOC113813823 [Penaeus vannamei]
MPRSQSRFRSGKNKIEAEPRSARPTMSVCEEYIYAVRGLIEKTDRRITTQSVADALNISVASAHTILLESLGLSKLSARWVPRWLCPDQKVETTEDIIQSKQWLPRARGQRSGGKVKATVF